MVKEGSLISTFWNCIAVEVHSSLTGGLGLLSSHGVIESFLNGTSAQLVYTVRFTLVSSHGEGQVAKHVGCMMCV